MLLRDEFIISMNKFLSTMQRTIVQLEGEVRLQAPDLPELTDNDEQNLRNAELLDRIEEIVQGMRTLLVQYYSYHIPRLTMQVTN